MGRGRRVGPPRHRLRAPGGGPRPVRARGRVARAARALLRHEPGGRAPAGRRDAPGLRPLGQGRRLRPPPVGRHAPAAAAGAGAAPPAPPRDPRRADRRGRPRAAPRPLGVHPGPPRGRHDDPARRPTTSRRPRRSASASRSSAAGASSPTGRRPTCASASGPTGWRRSTSRWSGDDDRPPGRGPPEGRRRPGRARGAARAAPLDPDDRAARRRGRAVHRGLRRRARAPASA